MYKAGQEVTNPSITLLKSGEVNTYSKSRSELPVRFRTFLPLFLKAPKQIITVYKDFQALHIGFSW